MKPYIVQWYSWRPCRGACPRLRLAGRERVRRVARRAFKRSVPILFFQASQHPGGRPIASSMATTIILAVPTNVPDGNFDRGSTNVLPALLRRFRAAHSPATAIGHDLGNRCAACMSMIVVLGLIPMRCHQSAARKPADRGFHRSLRESRPLPVAASGSHSFRPRKRLYRA
jgi:hypothetical protein